MLIHFTVENWRSYRDKTVLNFVANKEKQHSERVAESGKSKLRLLPCIAIYGGNASGKSNIVKALQFAKWMIVTGPAVNRSIPIETFRVDPQSRQKPVSFSFEIVVSDEKDKDNSDIFEYSFVLGRNKVQKEKLILVKSNSEVTLFERSLDEETGYTYTVDFDSSIQKDTVLRSVLVSTRDNQLFLTNAASQNVSKYNKHKFLGVFSWFTRLICITPDTVQGISFVQQKDEIANYLRLCGTGVVGFGLENVDPQNIEIPPRILDRLTQEPSILNLPSASGRRFVCRRNDDGNIEVQKFVTYHSSDSGENIPFDTREESDGTLRVMDLLPRFIDASQPESEQVIVIDELDRSLHSLLLRGLLEGYLSSCNKNSRSQLIFTTHDLYQMDQNLFRRDEMWVTERKNDGSTELVPLSSFRNIRSDTVIRNLYLNGHVGGIPKISLTGSFSNTNEEGTSE